MTFLSIAPRSCCSICAWVASIIKQVRRTRRLNGSQKTFSVERVLRVFSLGSTNNAPHALRLRRGQGGCLIAALDARRGPSSPRVAAVERPLAPPVPALGHKRTSHPAPKLGFVRFTPESGHSRRRSVCPICANSGHRAGRRCNCPMTPNVWGAAAFVSD